MKLDICAKCGLTKEEHHDFQPIEVPDGCVCNIKEWGNPRKIPPICSNYVDDNGLCKNCEHEEKCHKKT